MEVSLGRPCGRTTLGVGVCFMFEVSDVWWEVGDGTLRLGGRWVGKVDLSIPHQAEALRGGQGPEEPRAGVVQLHVFMLLQD